MTSQNERLNERESYGILIAHILANLPTAYDNVADRLARDQEKSITSVTNELKQKFERMK
jgi:hypothetical protein